LSLARAWQARRLAARPAHEISDSDAARGFRVLAVPQARLRVRVVGHGEPTLVLQPDPPCVIEHYEPFIAALARQRRVVAFEPPGFGHSFPSADFRFTAEDYAATLEAVCDALDLSGVTLVHTCLGSFAALIVARRRPELVGRLVLSQTPSLPELKRWVHRLDPLRVMSVPLFGQGFVALARDTAIRLWYRQALPAGTDVEPWADRALAAQESGGCYSLASVVQGIGGLDPAMIAGVRQPTTLVWGDADPSHRATNKDATRDLLPQAELVRLPDAGHFPEIEKHTAYAELVLSR
jgi:pimeloyl-ACP methyl ester carboxylesterase